jgi:hypothetical protein
MEPRATPIDLWKTIKPQIMNLDVKFQPPSSAEIKAIMRGEDRNRDSDE